ncbi:MAG: hypothetical protein LC791_12880, partial [Acidobacteria bacterium]|nr:hypothetical protein [Acidobacteriota bacterium]
LDTLRLHMTAARDEAAATGRASHLILERQRAIFAAGGVLIWLIAAALLVPIGRPRHPAAREMPSAAPVAAASLKTSTKRDLPLSVTSAKKTPPAHRVAPETASALSVAAKGPDVTVAAALCGDLARASNAQELEALLGRAAGVLNATGLIVWLAKSTTLYPAASWGYDALLSRVTSIPCDSVNLTAAAFRTGSIRTSSASGGAPAAIAAPLVGPGGPVGVLSGEIRDTGAIDDTTRAVAAIFAAQLVTIVGSMPSTDSTTSALSAGV